ncbi:DUF5954 family protein [Streptomyces sp. TLI_146]|uniref:DUF5954 family protein n=1 Tax=Streptomyces sp. TLI_146 TaxID=1938858 RepID=UPI000C7008C6|nr:DUF5954 family protein [Streptomyces sp. TLI_146]
MRPARCARRRPTDRLDDKRRNALSVAERRFRVTRVERLVRIGPDGPEGPRPSDFDPHLPVDVQVRRLKEQGLWKEEDEPVELDEGTRELSRLMEQEMARAAAAKERKRRSEGD